MSLSHHRFDVSCFVARKLVSSAMSCVAQLCDSAPKLTRALKPFVACRDLIIVIPLYAWERIRVMTINDEATFESRMQVLG